MTTTPYTKEDDILVASQIWAVLVWAAKNQQTLTYKDLAVLAGRFWYQEFAQPLGIVYRYCDAQKKKDQGFPMLCYLVVQGTTRKPSPDSGLDLDKTDEEQKKCFQFAAKEWESLSGRKDNEGWENFKSESALVNPGVDGFRQFCS